MGPLIIDVIQIQLLQFLSTYRFFKTELISSGMDVLFGSSFSKLEDVGKPFTRCGQTKRYLQYIPGPPPRLYNKFTESGAFFQECCERYRVFVRSLQLYDSYFSNSENMLFKFGIFYPFSHRSVEQCALFRLAAT